MYLKENLQYVHFLPKEKKVGFQKTIDTRENCLEGIEKFKAEPRVKSNCQYKADGSIVIDLVQYRRSGEPLFRVTGECTPIPKEEEQEDIKENIIAHIIMLEVDGGESQVFHNYSDLKDYAGDLGIEDGQFEILCETAKYRLNQEVEDSF